MICRYGLIPKARSRSSNRRKDRRSFRTQRLAVT